MPAPASGTMQGMQLISVNTARVEHFTATDGQAVDSAIRKRARGGPVAVGLLGLEGDEQADPSVHGGRDKAVYAYPVAHYAFWQAQRRTHGVSLFEEALPWRSYRATLA